MRLNIGCGNTLKPGYMNIDRVDLVEAPINFINMDAFDIDRRFTQCFQEVYSEYFMEHLSPDEVRILLYKIHKVLLPNGIYRFVVPDITKIVHHFIDQKHFVFSNGLFLFNLEVFGPPEMARETMHKSIWSEGIARMYLEEEGLFEVNDIRTDENDRRGISILVEAYKK